MRSVLTRRVFRQIIRDEPFHHSRVCLEAPQRCAVSRSARIPRRNLFGFGGPKQESKPSTPIIDPGMALMMQLSERIKLHLRPHPREEISDAFRDFLVSKNRRAQSSSLTDLQVEHCLVAFDHLQQISPDGSSGLAITDLENALRSLVHPSLLYYKPGIVSDERRLQLANQVFAEATVRYEDLPESGETSSFEKKILYPYLKVLGMYGRGTQAMEVLDRYWQKGGQRSSDRSLWNQVIRGTVREDNLEETEDILAAMAEKGVPYNAVTQQVIIETLTAQDSMPGVKFWYHRPLDNGGTPLRRVKLAVAEMCMRHDDIDLGQSLITDIVQDSDLGIDEWNAIFSWAIVTGKGVEEVDRLMKVMERVSGQSGRQLQPDASTVNSLMKAALWQNNGYLAERILNFGRERGIKPNAKTWIMQIDHRLSQGDLQGSIEAFDQVRSRSFEIENDEDAAAVNRLIKALCEVQGGPDMNRIMTCVSDLMERKIQLEPATVAALATAHMRRDELHDAIDIMKTYAKNYDQSARNMIRDRMVEFCLAKETEIALAWDAYIIVHELFNETPRATRESVMANFFQRKRSDMAVHVFGHMRQFALPERRPSASTYQKCFEGLALAGGDEEILDIVHNMLKLDYEVDPSIGVNNALMMAQNAAMRPGEALMLWKDITESKEGPSYESIRIALMACESHPKGETEARKIWQTINSIGVEITKGIYTSFLWALAAHGKLEEAKVMIKELKERFGSGPDEVTLAILFNIVDLDLRDDITEWSTANFPDIWKQVEKKELVEAGELFSWDIYDIDRGVRS